MRFKWNNTPSKMEHVEKTERRHIRLPAESVSLCAENLGIQTSQEVTSSVVEDVSFRIRQLTDVGDYVILQGPVYLFFDLW